MKLLISSIRSLLLFKLWIFLVAFLIKIALWLKKSFFLSLEIVFEKIFSSKIEFLLRTQLHILQALGILLGIVFGKYTVIKKSWLLL